MFHHFDKSLPKKLKFQTNWWQKSLRKFPEPRQIIQLLMP